MSHRKSVPPPYDFVKALNLIDVVFSKNPTVISLWHEYYGLLHQDQLKNFHLWDNKLLELLSAMANDLGYKTLQQVDIDKFYVPVAHGTQFELSAKLLHELLRVLENTAKFDVSPKAKNQTSSKTSEE